MHKNEEERKAANDIGGVYFVGESDNKICWASKFEPCKANHDDFHFEIDDKNKQWIFGEKAFLIEEDELPSKEIWARVSTRDGNIVLEIKNSCGPYVEILNTSYVDSFSKELRIWPKGI